MTQRKGAKRARGRGLAVLGAGDLNGPAHCAALLRSFGIDSDTWPAQEGAKSIDHLFTELELGETRLEFFSGGVGVRRLVEVVKVRVTRPGEPQFTLIEAEQRFSCGSSRSRRRVLSEKLFPHEAPLEAARRGVLEELGTAMAARGEETITLDPDSLVSWVEHKSSSSFPSLPTRYQIWRIDAVVDGIPAANFTSLEKVATPDDAAAGALPAPAQEHDVRISRVWSGATLRRRRVTSRPLAVIPGELSDAATAAARAEAANIRLRMPEELMHVWEWVDTRRQRHQEQERLQREAGQQRRRLREEAAGISRPAARGDAVAAGEAGAGEATTPVDGCVMY